MASVNVTNWQAQLRTAGALMNLQATPMDPLTTYVSGNPKKSQGNVVSDHDRTFLPQWPNNTVYRIKESPGIVDTDTPLINTLELETSSVIKAAGCNGDTSTFYLMDSLGSAPGTGHQHSGVWSGGDGLVYKNVTIYQNLYTPADTNGDGILEDYWQVSTNVYGLDAYGAWYQVSGSIAYNAGSPTTTGIACAYNGNNTYGGFFADSNNSIYGTFSNLIYANEFASTYATALTYAGNEAKFCVRKNGDSGHGLKNYVSYNSNGYVLSANGSSMPNLIFSVRESTTQNPVGNCNLQDTTCRWYYTPTNACSDCWYAGKTVTVEITYKEAQLTRNLTMYTEGEYDVTYSLGSWATHSTVTQTLVLPSGTTRQAINAAFDVPTKNGYVVAIDDIKLVSVT